jgi:hypothetical protein
LRWVVLGMAIILALWFWQYNKDWNQFNRTEKDYKEDSLAFDSQRWKRMGREDKHYMIKDLLERHLKPGMDSFQVQNLLGQPLPQPNRKVGWSYELGYYRDLDPVYLEIKWDAAGRLQSVAVQER